MRPIRMNTDISQPPGEPTVCDTTPLRYFAFVDAVDLLSAACGGTLRVPRQILDPDESTDLPDQLLSEIGKSIRYQARQQDADASRRWSLLMALKSRQDLDVLDLTESEEAVYSDLTRPRGGREP